jgi:GntR family transcriptional regulator
MSRAGRGQRSGRKLPARHGVVALRRDSHVSLYVQIADHLEREIHAGQYGNTGKLPSEQALMERFKVSRVTVRLALGHLMNQGLVVRKQGKGTFVAGHVVRHDLKTLKGFYDVLVAQGLTPDTELLTFEPTHPPPEIADAMEVGQGRLVLLRRLYRLDGLPIGVATTWLPLEAAKVAWKDAETHFSYHILQDLLGLPIARASIEIHGRRAGKELGALLELDAGAPLLVLERISYGPGGEPREFTRFAVNSETYKFTVNAEGAVPFSAGVMVAGIAE